MKKRLLDDPNEWAIEARVLLASLVLTEPRTTLSQQETITYLLKSAHWIDTFERAKSPWVKRSKRGRPPHHE